MRKWARCVCWWGEWGCIVAFPGLLQQCDWAQSWLRNAEWRNRRVSTPLLLTQPKAGMYDEQVETLSAGDVQMPGLPRATHATHSNTFPLPSVRERKSSVEQPGCKNKNASQGCDTHCGCSSCHEKPPDQIVLIVNTKLNACCGCHAVADHQLSLAFLCLQEHHHYYHSKIYVLKQWKSLSSLTKQNIWVWREKKRVWRNPTKHFKSKGTAQLCV